MTSSLVQIGETVERTIQVAVIDSSAVKLQEASSNCV
jgi:hypothetical protein